MQAMDRRHWLKLGASGFFGALLPHCATPEQKIAPSEPTPVPQLTEGKIKRIVFLFQAGGPSQLESFDPKPGLVNLRDTAIPPSIIGDRRLTTMTSGQDKLGVANALVNFSQHGQSGMWFSELFPHMATLADDMCKILTTHMDAVNHDPATNMAITGSEIPGRPSIGAWLSYALGSANSSLPSFVVMQSETKSQFVQPLTKRLWSSAFLPATHQGVALRPGDEPVLYLDDDIGLADDPRRELFDAVREMNGLRHTQTGDPDLLQRNDAYAVAASMQHSIRELADARSEPEEVFDLYGPMARVPGSYAANCLRARRLLERDVRCVMVMHRGWDHHYNVTAEMRLTSSHVDQPSAALIHDLKRLGMLEDTLVVWGGEFGRTAYSQGEVMVEDHGRDHHPYCYPTLLVGGGVKPGFIYGETDDFSFNIVKDPVHIHDLHATLLHLIGVDHTKLTYRHEGRDHRLTDLGGRVVHEILT